MDLFLLLGTGVYFCFVVIIFSGLLFRKKMINPEANLPPISVVISARNEEKNISNLLNDLVNQSVDKNQLEILIANDRSDDSTGKIIDRFASDYSFIKAIHIDKKHNNLVIQVLKNYTLKKSDCDSTWFTFIKNKKMLFLYEHLKIQKNNTMIQYEHTQVSWNTYLFTYSIEKSMEYNDADAYIRICCNHETYNIKHYNSDNVKENNSKTWFGYCRTR